MMKHFMLPKTSSFREANPLSELSPSPHSNPNPNKSKSNRKLKCPPRDKENTEPSSVAGELLAGKPSPSPAKLRSPLPPRPPPCNPLKRKLSNDLVSDIIGLGVGVGPPCSSSLSDTGVRVVVRMRPLNKDEEDSEMIVQKMSNDSLLINGHTFTYDSVADTESTQLEIFDLVGSPLVENCLAGFNSSVFAYGQTGSGKTYTMWGPANALLEENLANEQQGLTPRVFERLFARINEEQIKHADKQLTYQCRCSFLEIYNEQITDLLDPTQKNLQIREDVKSGVYVENLKEECVSTVKDVIRLLLKGLSHRKTGVTSVNAESSRSHSVFTCVVESQCKSMTDGVSSFKTSRINLVDLAGSERQKLTGAAGERLKEAGNINRSLSQLGNLINILAEVSQTGKQRHIPYRDSRLTFLLQESLGGNAKLAMICAISPSQSCRSETFSTLRFAQRAKAIKNKAVVNEVTQDDINVLREVIKQLKDELQRMKAHGDHNNPNAAYANSWNARRSLSLLKFSLNHPMALRHLDEDGDIEMEVVDEAVDKLCHKVGLESTGTKSITNPGGVGKTSINGNIESQISEVSDVSMEEGMSEIDTTETIVDTSCSSNNKTDGIADMEEAMNETPSQATEDSSVNMGSSLTTTTTTVAVPANNLPCGSLEAVTTTTLSLIPCDVSPILPSPAPSVSPRPSVTSSRKSLKSSTMLTASQKAVQSSGLGNQPRRTTDNLAASLHRGLEIIECQRQSSAFRTSPLRFSFKPTELKTILPLPKIDVGTQTLSESPDMLAEDSVVYVCSTCKKRIHNVDEEEATDPSNLQLVPVDRSLPAEKPMKQVPKAVEKVLAGAIRREMALEDFCAKQSHEISHLNRLVQQYKHERECNAIIGQMREDKINRLENLMDGVLPSEDFMEEEFICLRKEHEILKEKYENHPEVLETRIELERAQDELERLRNFFDMGEKEVLVEEIHDLRSQLQYYTENSPKARQRKSLLQLTYSCDPSPCPQLNPIVEANEENAMEKLEQERTKWTEVESQWISLADELKLELETCRSHAEVLERELVAEKKCSDELKEAMQLAMEGHARMLEQYADLEEKHMQMLARHRKMQEGIEDVKKAAVKSGVKGPESKFINILAAQISAFRVEKEKERRYLRDENKMLQSQLRDTAEAVQAAGELLVRLKEAEEAIAAAETRALKAEEETQKLSKQIDELKKQHELEMSTLNHVVAKSPPFPDHKQSAAKYDAGTHESFENNRWKEEFEGFFDKDADDDLSSKLSEPASWFSGYDRCNI
ncbi:kinesin-like protein KIN-12B [Silene latifolia]|uniref:kinesin-like protein KIN-12B n=1 Tax=Silene latifolia TaxID=37657 RepID=UPI003D7777FC